MTLNDYSSVLISGTGPSLSQVGFGTLGIAGYHTHWSERSRVYTALSELVTDGFSTSEPLYMAMGVALSQTPCPKEIKILRLANAPVMSVRVTPLAVDGAAYELSIVQPGKATVDISVTADGSATVDEICDALETALNTALLTSMGTSTSSVAVATGAKTFTTQAGLHFPVGSKVVATSVLGSDSMTGTVTSYSGTTLVLNVASVVGSGTDTDWTFTQQDVIVTPDGGTATYLTLSAAAGIWFAVQGWNTSRLKVEDLTPDPGIAADLAAIRQEDDDWYGFGMVYGARAIQEEAADYLETLDAIYGFDTSDWQAWTNASSADIWSILSAKSYVRGICYPCRNQGTFAGVAGLAERLPWDPGSPPSAGGTFHSKTLKGVVTSTWTPTEKAALRDKLYTVYQRTAGLNLTLGGETPVGEFLDYTRFNDWFRIRLQEDFVGVQAANQRVGYDVTGIKAEESACKSRLRVAIASGGAVDLINDDGTTSPPIVVMPALADTTSQERAARELGGGGIKIYYRYAGAIHFVNSVVTVTK